MKTRTKRIYVGILVTVFCSVHYTNAQLTYYLDEAAIECPKRDQIIYTMDTCLYIYNTYANYTGHVKVIYDPKVQTANAGYQGRIAFGGSAGGKTGTHEMQHVLGIGTYKNWGKNRDKDKKLWLGTKGIAQLKALDGPNAVLHADQSHFWPYGINTKWNNTHHHVYMVGALRQDMGLSNTSGQGNGGYCNPPKIIPRTKTNEKTILSAFAFATVGDTITLIPDAVKNATWSWTGPNGFTSGKRVIGFGNVTNAIGGSYTVTCTNECGKKSSREFTIIVSAASNYYAIQNHDTQWLLRPKNNAEGSEMVAVPISQADEYTQWEKIDTDNGWFYLKNRATGKYFRPLSSNQPARMEQVATTNTGNRVQWRFIGTEKGYGYLMNREYYRKIRILSTDPSNNYIEQAGAGSVGGWTQWKFNVVNKTTPVNITTGSKKPGLQIAPNPSSGRVNIKFTLAHDNLVSITIFNTLGQVVHKLLDNNMYRQGTHEVFWDGKTYVSNSILNTEIFIVQVQAGNSCMYKKLCIKGR